MSLVPAPSLLRHGRAHGEPAGRLARAPLARCGPGDRFHDYVLGEYAPLVPHEGKLRSVNLLIESFALLGVEAQGTALIERLLATLARRDRTQLVVFAYESGLLTPAVRSTTRGVGFGA